MKKIKKAPKPPVKPEDDSDEKEKPKLVKKARETKQVENTEKKTRIEKPREVSVEQAHKKEEKKAEPKYDVTKSADELIKTKAGSESSTSNPVKSAVKKSDKRGTQEGNFPLKS